MGTRCAALCRKGVKTVDEAHTKARATRQKNQEAQRQYWAEQREAIKTVRKALLRVMEQEDATPAEIIQAAQLMAELGR